jgi:hypothetical protein
MKGDKDSAGFVEDVCTECNKVVWTLPEFFHKYKGKEEVLCEECLVKFLKAEGEAPKDVLLETTPAIAEADKNAEAQARIDAMDDLF